MWNFNWFLRNQADDTYFSELFTVESLFDGGRYTGRDVIVTCSQERCGQILCVSVCVCVCVCVGERERERDLIGAVADSGQAHPRRQP